MLQDIVEAQMLGGFQIHVRFENGVEGEVNLGRLIRFEGVFAPLRDPKEFARLAVGIRDTGTICWPNGADLDPDVLYAEISGEPIPTWEKRIPMV